MTAFELCLRIEEKNPTDRVQGTVINVTAGGLFVVKYDNGDYVAYQPDQAEAFERIPHKPLPSHAAELIRHLRRKYGKLPPSDVGILRLEDTSGVPHPRRTGSDELTPHHEPPSIEA